MRFLLRTLPITLLWACLGILASTAAIQAQTTSDRQASRLRVFLDCDDSCFADYLRDEIAFVDFVYQPQDADVHVLATRSDTGGGGQEVVLRFVGLGRYAGHDEEFRAVSLVGDTESRRRDLVLRTTEIALLAFMAREGLPTDVSVSVESETQARVVSPTDDPWNAWVLSIRASADYRAEESNKQRRWQLDVGADRITERWKLTFGTSLDYRTEEFDLDADEPLRAVRRERETEWFVARGLGPHWSIGLDGRFTSSTFGNTELSVGTSPAIEFSVFPYEEYASRQLRLQSSVGVAHARYNEVTLYDQLSETHPIHEASVTLDQSQPWGSLEARLEFLQYLHDPSFYRLEVNGDLSWRILRGLSVTIEAGASRIHDQLSLPRRGATDKEVLLRLRELQSDYDLQFDIGFTYSFGALFNNVVNPRFGR